MKKILSILLSLALVVSLGALSVAPVMAVTLPSISPAAANFDLDNPGHIAVDLNFGDADDLDSIEDDVDALNPDDEYYQFEALVVITKDYLESVLTCIGDTVLLQFNFDPFGVAFLTVTAIGTAPGLQSSAEDWNYWTGGDVIVGIDWGMAADVADVSDDVGSLTETVDWVHTATTLNITDAYLSGKLTSIGDEVTLTVEFDSCDYDPVLTSKPHTATLKIKAVGVTLPKIAPTSAVYDKCNPGNVQFTITWAGAANIVDIWNVTNLSSPSQLLGFYYNVSGNTLTIVQAYVAAATAALGWAYLEVTFDDPAATKVQLLITAEWSDPPYMGVTSNIYTYDLDTGLGNLGTTGVGSLVNFGCATNVTGVTGVVKDAAGATKTSGALSVGTQYLTLYIVGYGYLCTITKAGYLDFWLTDLGDSGTFTVSFDKGDPATFIINAVGTGGSISPTSAEFNLDAPGNITTTVTLGPHASNFTITGLTLGEDYTVDGDTVTILASYLASVLTTVGDVAVLTFDFDVGSDAKFTIKAVGTPLCFIATAAYGTPMAEEIQILREFRDRYLLANPLGRALVDLYYRVSPPVAEFITEHAGLQPIVRAMLLPALVMSAVAVNTTPAMQIAILGLLLVSAAAVVWATRRRERGPSYA